MCVRVCVSNPCDLPSFRVLQELMTPVECLMPTDTMGQNHEGKRIIYELESAIVNAKKLFLDVQVTKAIVDLMSSLLQVCNFVREHTSFVILFLNKAAVS